MNRFVTVNGACPWWVLLAAGVLCAQSDPGSGAAAPSRAIAPATFRIIVSKEMVDLAKTKPAAFGIAAVDSVPFLTLEDIRFLRFDRAKWVETAFEFAPGAYERLRPRLPGLYMHSFILFLNNEPVYSGILVQKGFSRDYLRNSHYSGPIIVLPTVNAIPDKLARVTISFVSQDGIYRRKDDPRGNAALIDFFKKAGKLMF